MSRSLGGQRSAFAIGNHVHQGITTNIATPDVRCPIPLREPTGDVVQQLRASAAPSDKERLRNQVKPSKALDRRQRMMDRDGDHKRLTPDQAGAAVGFISDTYDEGDVEQTFPDLSNGVSGPPLGDHKLDVRVLVPIPAPKIGEESRRD